MNRDATGTYRVTSTAGEKVRAFVPLPLPPTPPLEITGPRQLLLEKATLAVGGWTASAPCCPTRSCFSTPMFGAKPSCPPDRGHPIFPSDLLLFELEEAPGSPIDDVVEVSNYVAALNHGMERLREGFPLSNRLLREMHAS